MKRKTCPTCQGEGKLISEYSAPPHMVCWDCGGTGRTGSIVDDEKGAGDDYPVVKVKPIHIPTSRLVGNGGDDLRAELPDYNTIIAENDKEIDELKGALAKWDKIEAFRIDAGETHDKLLKILQYWRAD